MYAHYGQQPQRMCVLTASGENTENVKTLDTIVVLKTTVFNANLVTFQLAQCIHPTKHK